MKEKYGIQRCSVRELKPGMQTGQTLYSDSGTAWLGEGTTLNDEMIRRLQRLGLENVFIRVSENQAEPAPASTADETPAFMIAPSALREKVDNEYEEVLDAVRRFFTVLSNKGKPDTAEIERIADRILDWTKRSAFLANYLLISPPRRDYPIQHSVHVAAISGIIGTLLALPPQQLKELVLSGLLHDVGFITASGPTSVSGLLPEELEDIKTHPVSGYKVLQSLNRFPVSVLYGVLQHHERFDGSGYPLGVAEEKIHLYAKVIGVADSFELMNFNRATLERPSPFLVMQRLKEEMIGKLDIESCTALLEYLANSVLGNIVLLSDGDRAQVVFWHQADSLPVVRKENGQFIHLSRQRQVSIEEILEA